MSSDWKPIALLAWFSASLVFLRLELPIIESLLNSLKISETDLLNIATTSSIM
ncbi:MAG: hypothetical protein IIA59_06105 [Candidatus Marinimicrobia bacterium]|nr:hypothetical protein [Candidatus Neomarinimicrobiota bacterium]